MFTNTGHLALAGFLAGYRGLTRQAYELDLRQFARLCTIAGFYRYAVEEELLDHSPAAHVRRPRLDYESHAVGLDRNELGALLVAAGIGPPAEHALISLNGLRVSEANGAGIEALGIERGHRTLVINRKGGKVVTVPLAPRTPGRSTWPSVNAPKDPSSWPLMSAGRTGTAPGGSSGGWPAGPGSPAACRQAGYCCPGAEMSTAIRLQALMSMRHPGEPAGGHPGCRRVGLLMRGMRIRSACCCGAYPRTARPGLVPSEDIAATPGR